MKERALGQIPKGYPLKNFVDGGKILHNNQLRTNALELLGQKPREGFHTEPPFGVYFGGQARGGVLWYWGLGVMGMMLRHHSPCLFFY